MTPNEYQHLAARTLAEPMKTHGAKSTAVLAFQLQLTVLTTKLAGEVGELCELIGKAVGHDVIAPDHLDKVGKEIGDAFWYLSAIAKMHGLDIETIMEENIAKLKARYPEGFVTGGGIR